ncbi:DUF2723 domain-containing protein [candidate division GN15 bacterium]|nr:DUF2723 domain-containing protein [candidate division GN15 bacterium]
MKLFGQHIDRTNALIAGLVWLGVLTVYTMTKAATMSFWDCGEFIAVAAILGIPHPPGTPLYISIAHLFSQYIPYEDISARVNYLSALSSSFSALFAYLVAVRILRRWFGDDLTALRRILMYAGGVCGALFLAFGFTQWINSIEAEVYGLSMLIMMAAFWLTLIYIDKWGTRTGDRIMLLIVYLATLGIGVHMATFLILPISALFFVLKKDTPASGWFLVALFFVLELFLIFILSSRPDEIPYYLPVLIVFIFYIFYVFSFENVPRHVWFVALGFLVSVAPVLSVIAGQIGGGASGSPPAVLSVIGVVGLLATLSYAVICLMKYRTQQGQRSGEPDMHLLYPSLFVFAAVALTAIAVVNLRGYHVFLILSVILLAALGILLRRHLNWFTLIPLIGVGMIILGVEPFAIGLIGAAIVSIIIGVVRKDDRWKHAIVMLVVAMIGFSVHVYIPVRSAQDPFINENDPSQSLEATIQFIERKQYGSESMVERMFERRGEWENQFGDYERMGFWGFFQEQYGLTGPRFFLLFMLGLFGVWEVVRRKPRIGLHLLLLLLITSVGLVLYMNFADGTRQLPTGQDYLEVRDRDYFFTGAFILFGMTIGIGVATLVDFVAQSVRKFSRPARKIIVTATCVLFLLPVYAIAGNYYECDRSNNYVAYDYGFNLLMSADENAVLFTNGDNDTFPLWCLQEAYGLRKDVRVVNLSLANLDWYIKQLRDYMGLELGWTDEEIGALRGYRFKDGSLYRISHQVIDAIYVNNYPRVPMNWAVTCSPGFRRIRNEPIDDRLELAGMKWSLQPSGTGMTVNVERSKELLTDSATFRFRGLNDPSIYKNGTALRVTYNMAHTILMVADTLRRAGQLDEAVEMARLAVENIPHNRESVKYLAKLYADMGELDKLEALVQREPSPEKEEIAVFWARGLRTVDEHQRAQEILDSIIARHPNNESVFEELVKLHVEQQQLIELQVVLQRWLRQNPGHERAQSLLNRLEQEMIRMRMQSGGSDTGQQ